MTIAITHLVYCIVRVASSLVTELVLDASVFTSGIREGAAKIRSPPVARDLGLTSLFTKMPTVARRLGLSSSARSDRQSDILRTIKTRAASPTSNNVDGSGTTAEAVLPMVVPKLAFHRL